MADHYKLSLEGISKSFPGVKALDRVTFNLALGEVHALCGENGAGKTTLMNVLSGNLQPDQGSIWIDQQRVEIKNQLDGQKKGIGIVYQEKSLIDGLSVADNIFAGHQPLNRFGLIDRKKLHRRTERLLSRLGIEIRPAQILADLSPGKQQMVEVAKALALNPNILILDEPTAAISERDAQILFTLVEQLAKSGTSIIYISHRLPEIFKISDRVTILKDGVSQGTFETSALDIDKVVRLMVGRDLKALPYADQRTDEVVLRVEDFTGTRFKDIALQLRAGEILGLSGLVGAGRSEFARALFGIDAKKSGLISLYDREVQIRSTHQAILEGLGYLPEDRKRLGIFIDMSILDNIQCIQQNFSNRGSDDRRSPSEHIREIIEHLRIKAPSLSEKVRNLSGGNQQKVIFARWLLVKPKILMIDEPTAGIDVGAKYEIYQILKELTAQGKSILLISSDLPELIGICDRILVFRSGNISAEFERREFNEEEIMHYASGTKLSA